MKSIGLIKFLPGIAWFFVILVLISLPGKDIPKVSWLDKIYFDKWVHTGIFCLQALLFMLPIALSTLDNKQKLVYFFWIAIATSAWGISTEFIQKYLVVGRSFDPLDWVADSFGALISYVFCRKKFYATAT